MARPIDADELLEFPYSESAGTDEQIVDWIEECGLSDEEVIDSAKKLCWMVIEGFINLIKTEPTLTTPNEPERAGLYGKYTVYKNKDGSLVTGCFILRPEKDPAAVAALRAYAAATDNTELASDIIKWVGDEPNEPLTIEQLLEMEGEPAYIPETNCWVLVTKNPFVPLFTWPDGEQCSAYDWYEQVGPVYRRPPEGEEDI